MYSEGVFPLLLLLSNLYAIKPDCKLAEEGQETTLTCIIKRAVPACPSLSILILEWRVNKPTSVIMCSASGCGGGYSSRYGFSATINNSASTLTITNVSRTDPFNMETRWICWPCRDSSREVTACDKLVVFAKPENPNCTVRENTAVPGVIESVTVSCSTTKVYPEAKCSFRRRTIGGTFVTINKTPTYDHTQTTGSPAYYRSECSVDVPVAELGEGNHSFSTFIYPNVTGGIDLVAATTASTTVKLTLPETSYTCSTKMIQGYFNGKSARCTCNLILDGYPKGQAQWYRSNQRVPGVSGGVLDLTFDSSNPEQSYSCKGVSVIGKSPGLTLRAKFAYFEENVVSIESPSTIDLCSETNYTNTRILITCRVPKDKISPAPIFSVSQDGLTFDLPRKGCDVSTFYQSQFYPSPDVGGVYQVTCRVINKITGITQERKTPVTFRMITTSMQIKKGSSDDTAVIIGVTVAVVVVLVIAIITVVLVLRCRNSKKVKASAPPQENRYVDIYPNPDDGYEQSVDQAEGEGICPEVNQYEEITLHQVNEYDVPRDSGERQEASK